MSISCSINGIFRSLTFIYAASCYIRRWDLRNDIRDIGSGINTHGLLWKILMPSWELMNKMVGAFPIMGYVWTFRI